MSVFWKNTLSILKEKNLKQVDISKATVKPQNTISTWIARDTIPQADVAVKIADLLGVSVRYLVTGEDDAELSALEKELLKECEGLSDPMMLKVIKEAKDLKIMQQQEKRTASPDTSDSEAM